MLYVEALPRFFWLDSMGVAVFNKLPQATGAFFWKIILITGMIWQECYETS